MSKPTSKNRSGPTTPAIAHDHKYFFFDLLTAYGLHATTESFQCLVNEIIAEVAALPRQVTGFGLTRCKDHL